MGLTSPIEEILHHRQVNCGSSVVECNGSNVILSVTIVEFTLNDANGLDFFNVNLVKGYNLSMIVEP
ncbi:hypothetical protein JHK82_034474 [Glycine max]|nr:hypothetical protein JHK82_034474 [Glycine max]KAG5141040.1 hypothetical protein JHK84_034808 [Glycine max]